MAKGPTLRSYGFDRGFNDNDGAPSTNARAAGFRATASNSDVAVRSVLLADWRGSDEPTVMRGDFRDIGIDLNTLEIANGASARCGGIP